MEEMSKKLHAVVFMQNEGVPCILHKKPTAEISSIEEYLFSFYEIERENPISTAAGVVGDLLRCRRAHFTHESYLSAHSFVLVVKSLPLGELPNVTALTPESFLTTPCREELAGLLREVKSARGHHEHVDPFLNQLV
jgi:hypothetical protein